MSQAKQALNILKGEIEKREKRTILSFEEFLEAVSAEPERLLRNIFQLFHDMVQEYVGDGENEYPDDPESIGYVKYDCSRLFIKEADNPFFADRLFANRFINQIKSLRQGSRQNQLHAYLGPHGCGKSTFLNNLMRAFERYTSVKNGQTFEILWEINGDDDKGLEVPCPSHDHPILIIPKEGNYRINFLKNLLSEEAMEKIFKEKEYEWVLKGEVCTICKSIFWNLFDKFGDIDRVWSMIRARSYTFDRRLGEGISVFNPGDKIMMPTRPMIRGMSSDAQIQRKLDQIFGANLVKYTFSRYAKTNNGIYVLMDVKGENRPRLAELHNIITEGVHRVGDIEEGVNSFFVALMNPEDKGAIEGDQTDKFEGRIQEYSISYVLEVPTEIKIYHSVFGKQINDSFLPRVLENFARVIIASRMEEECEPLTEWLVDLEKYEKYCDGDGFLLRMEIYSGVIPPWLSEEDRKKFTAKVRKSIIAFGEKEGSDGFDGRRSIKLFGDFLSRYGRTDRLITMKDVVEYFTYKIDSDLRDNFIPAYFIDSLVNWYDYVVLSEVKESLYFYNDDQIREWLLHYLCAINHQPDGSQIECVYTKKKVEVTIDFFKTMGFYLTGEMMSDRKAIDYASDVQEEYARVLSRERDKDIIETELFQGLFVAYTKNLKEKALQPFLENDTFWDAVAAFPDGKSFNAADGRLKEHITHMIENLVEKFGYTQQGAKEICLYVKSKRLVELFA